MKNKFFTDKFVPAPKFAGVGRMEDYYGEGFNKGYDSGFPYEADFGIFNSPAFRRPFPAVLQCGGYGDCRALFGRERAGWGGEKEKAVRHILYYWGGMVRQGADTFL